MVPENAHFQLIDRDDVFVTWAARTMTELVWDRGLFPYYRLLGSYFLVNGAQTLDRTQASNVTKNSRRSFVAELPWMTT